MLETTPMSAAADSTVIWMDGELVPYERAQVHVLSHSLHYGSAAFEGIRAYKTADGRTAIFRGIEHAKRFAMSMGAYGAECQYSEKELVDAMAATIKANGFDECYVRPLAYIGHESRGLKLPAVPKMHIAIAVWRWGKYLGETVMQKGIRVNVASFRRPDVSSSLPWAKLSGNYLNSIMARREATLAGVDEALLLDQQGYVAEGSGENVFVLLEGKLATPQPNAILPGITRNSIMEIAHTQGLTVVERPITRNQLYAADEVFFTGTAAEVTPICQIDGRKIGKGVPGPVCTKLATTYDRVVRGQEAAFKQWLSYV